MFNSTEEKTIVIRVCNRLNTRVEIMVTSFPVNQLDQRMERGWYCSKHWKWIREMHAKWASRGNWSLSSSRSVGSGYQRIGRAIQRSCTISTPTVHNNYFLGSVEELCDAESGLDQFFGKNSNLDRNQRIRKVERSVASSSVIGLSTKWLASDGVQKSEIMIFLKFRIACIRSSSTPFLEERLLKSCCRNVIQEFLKDRKKSKKILTVKTTESLSQCCESLSV